MRIDFAQTRLAVEEMLRESIARFRNEHPEVLVKRLTLWGYGFGKCAHVLLETSDDRAVFGGRFGEYNDNEYGRIYFDDWWPDLYACPEGEPYEIHLHGGAVVRTMQSEQGNDAIDRPLFGLLKDVLAAADLSGVRRDKRLALTVEMGSSGLAESWEAAGG